MFSQSHFHANVHGFILKVTTILLFRKTDQDKICSGKMRYVKEGSIVNWIFGFGSKHGGSSCLGVTFQREVVH